ncbi:hypothetical protein PI124_g19102 [Phytophthora idaei]|nr:hypothetical protein PI125_g21283 [Phytophthora idaei]KAG3134892.1 hypothetical protein PI126_g18497 [Phytophthora idaei]KAG3235879.1 hypothetical protein PI124_g19102 [Phytophthora idaei]
MSGLITAGKESDAVTYTRGGNPRPPPVETVADWVSAAWKRVPEKVVMSSIYGCGFDDDFEEWFISKHDVYGDLFRTKWLLRNQNPDSAANEYDNDVSMALDELVIE